MSVVVGVIRPGWAVSVACCGVGGVVEGGAQATLERVPRVQAIDLMVCVINLSEVCRRLVICRVDV